MESILGGEQQHADGQKYDTLCIQSVKLIYVSYFNNSIPYILR
jgi:hypothetical protein